MTLKLGIMLNYATVHQREELIATAREAEALGYDSIWASEAWSFDVFTTLTHIACHTERIKLGTNIAQLYSRTPALLASTAASLDQISGGRFILGVGASGPQVIEGWHGVPYDRPVQRTREIIEICRMVWRRQEVRYDGRAIKLPLPADQGTGLGKALKILTHPVRDRIPIWLASMGEKSVELTAELAEG